MRRATGRTGRANETTGSASAPSCCARDLVRRVNDPAVRESRPAHRQDELVVHANDRLLVPVVARSDKMSWPFTRMIRLLVPVAWRHDKTNEMVVRTLRLIVRVTAPSARDNQSFVRTIDLFARVVRRHQEMIWSGVRAIPPEARAISQAVRAHWPDDGAISRWTVGVCKAVSRKLMLTSARSRA